MNALDDPKADERDGGSAEKTAAFRASLVTMNTGTLPSMGYIRLASILLHECNGKEKETRRERILPCH